MPPGYDREDAMRVRITSHSLVSCLGYGQSAHRDALVSGRTGLAPCAMAELPFDCFVGRVPDIENLPFPESAGNRDNRANRLAFAALQTDGFGSAVEKARERWGADRCGVVLGTSTSGVEKLETVYRQRDSDAPLPATYEMRYHDDHQAVAGFLQSHLRLTGPSYTISTACSSSAKALVDAIQLVEAGFCDAVLTGGVDSLCLTSLNGFEAMQLISRQPCRPCDADRNGLSIGEAAALLLVERDAEAGFRFTGYGETSDGVSMSTPPEDGAGAARAMRAALDKAGLAADRIGYVNLHGTATRNNDAAECTAVTAVFGSAKPASSLKGAVGHTLGAAGAVEAAICLIALETGVLPGNVGLHTLDPAIACDIVAHARRADLDHVMSNAFGFGGNNCALVLSK